MASGANNNPPKLGANGSNSNNESQTADLGDEHQFKKRKRACKSKVWIDMIKIDNDTRAQCIHCKECYVIPDTGTTITLEVEKSLDSNAHLRHSQDTETLAGTMFLNVEQLENQLDKEDFQEIGSMASFNVLETQF
nr:zinc finger, BED-type [Tanacetum cinerariifolium]